MTTIIGIDLDNRLETAVELQKILTRYGCIINTRIGLHSANSAVCSSRGIVLLEVFGEAQPLQDELSKNWTIQTMLFE